MPEIADYSLLDMAEAARIASQRKFQGRVVGFDIASREQAKAIAGLAYENAALLAERMGHDDVAEAIRELAEML